MQIKLKGRRIALFLASALTLLAHDDLIGYDEKFNLSPPELPVAQAEHPLRPQHQRIRDDLLPLILWSRNETILRRRRKWSAPLEVEPLNPWEIDDELWKRKPSSTINDNVEKNTNARNRTTASTIESKDGKLKQDSTETSDTADTGNNSTKENDEDVGSMERERELDPTDGTNTTPELLTAAEGSDEMSETETSLLLSGNVTSDQGNELTQIASNCSEVPGAKLGGESDEALDDPCSKEPYMPGTSADGDPPEDEIPDQPASTEAMDGANEEAVSKEPESPDTTEEDKLLLRVDYASKSAGALVLEQSESFQGSASNLLTKSKDQYAIIPCEEKEKVVVIGLSEDILVKKVGLANYERFSSHVEEFRVQGSMTMGDNWVDLGTFKASRQGKAKGKQSFTLEKPSWARYLRFVFLTHHGNDYYCTISQISVHGSTMLQGFHEQWVEQEEVVETSEETATPETNASANASTLGANLEERPPSRHNCITRMNSVTTDSTSFAELESMYAGLAEQETPVLSADLFASITLISRRRVVDEYLTVNQTQNFILFPPVHKPVICKISPRTEQSLVHLVHTEIVQSHEEIETEGDKIDEAPTADSSEDVDTGSSEEHAAADSSPPEVEDEPPQNEESKDMEVGATNDEKTEDQRDSVPDTNVSDHETKSDLAEMAATLAKALDRFPSATCLMELEFKSASNIASSRATSGKGGGLSSGATYNNNNPMEPIFKKLTDEIKILQASVAAHDLHAQQTIMCYQRVLMDVMIETENLRRDHESRLLDLEKKAQEAFTLSNVWKWFAHFSYSTYAWLREKYPSLMLLYRDTEAHVKVMIKFMMPIVHGWMDQCKSRIIALSCSALTWIGTALSRILPVLSLPNWTLDLPTVCIG